MARKKKSKSRKRSVSRRLSLIGGSAVTGILVILAIAGEWFVHHPRSWITEKTESWPTIVTGPLLWAGNPVADVTDGLGLTGHDTVYEYDEEAPSGSICFAGTPVRTSGPSPSDIQIVNRGEFCIGWSPSLRHPVWCAYHVTRENLHEDGKRPSFLVDRSVPACPHPNDYNGCGYDRGHMAPNHAIVSRYGDDVRRLTFLMSNIAPQTAELNRGVWRDIEHRIADLWTARYGEIWVVVGCIPSKTREKLTGNTGIDVPSEYFQVIIAQEGMDVRALAMIFPQNVDWGAWAARYIVTIDELEERTGLDFNPELPEFISSPLESELPSRLWPVRPLDIISQILIRFN